MKSTVRTGVAWALMSAVLFGLSTPVAKLLLGNGPRPQLLAGLFYLGSGLGLALWQGWRRFRGGPPREARLRPAHWPPLLLAVLLGGALAPTLLLLGLAQTPAASAALLLNLEGVATMLLAWLAYRENVDRRLLLGALSIVAGALLLSWNGSLTFGAGAALIALACVCWGIDNNLTRALSDADPVQIALIKGLIAGATNTLLAFAQGSGAPTLAIAAGAALVGFFGYGVSLVLFVHALRHLGAARSSAYFSTAPFIGAITAVALLHDPLGWQLPAAGALMALGVYLHLSESHDHEHVHEAMEHEHAHVHDEHHQHAHEDGTPGDAPHSHRHRHAPLIHKHPHYPDLHHHHGH
jgi:drug/metabolite transporter (DMT)-like permease